MTGNQIGRNSVRRTSTARATRASSAAANAIIERVEQPRLAGGVTQHHGDEAGEEDAYAGRDEHASSAKLV